MPQLLQYVNMSQLVHINTILFSDSYVKSTETKQENAVLQKLQQWVYTISFWKCVVERYTVLPSNTFLKITNKDESQKQNGWRIKNSITRPDRTNYVV